MPPQILVLSCSLAEAYQPSPDTICISIASPVDEVATLSRNFSEVLYLGFDDIRGPLPPYVAFQPRHARAVLSLLARHPLATTIVVHCQMGASRSPGVALGIADACRWPTQELEVQFPHHNAYVRRTLALTAEHDAP